MALLVLVTPVAVVVGMLGCLHVTDNSLDPAPVTAPVGDRLPFTARMLLADSEVDQWPTASADDRLQRTGAQVRLPRGMHALISVA